VVVALAVSAAPATAQQSAGTAAPAPAAVTQTAADLCRGGERLLAAGDEERAYATLAAAASLPGGACAAPMLATARRALAIELCDRAAVVKKTDKAAAGRLYRRSLALRGGPTSCGRKALAPADKDDEQGRLADARDRLADAVVWVFQNLAWIALVLLLLWLAALMLTRWWDWWRRKAATSPLFRAVLRPRLQVAEFGDDGSDAKMGAGLAALVRGALGSIGDGRRLRLDIVSAHETLSEAFKGIGELSPRLKIVESLMALLDRALPVRRLTLGGQIVAPGPLRGVGVALNVQDRKALAAAAEVWERPRHSDRADPKENLGAEGYLRLVVPVTAWAELEINRLLERPSTTSTSSALSHSRAMSGRGWLAEGDMFAARLAFEEALEADARNWMARGNLATVESRCGHPLVGVLHAVQASDDFAETTTGEAGLRHPARYQLGYSLGNHRIRVMLDEEARATAEDTFPTFGKDAREESRAILADARSALELIADETTPDAETLRAFILSEVEPRTALQLAMILLLAPPPELATSAGDDPRSDLSIDELRELIAAAATPDLGLLLRFAVHPDRQETARTHFTAACFYATLAEHVPAMREKGLDLAIQELRISLAGAPGPEARRRAEQVDGDPALAPLRERGGAARTKILDTLVATFGDPPGTPEPPGHLDTSEAD
jgi:hypothetical protein